MTNTFLWLEPDEFPAWRRRLELERRARNLTDGRNLTPARRDALRAMLAFVGVDGALFPSDAAVAELAGCSARTVRRARADARELGLLSWESTRRLVNGRWRQGPNRYTVTIPIRPVCPGGQDGQVYQRKKEKRPTRQEQAAALAVPLGQPSLAEIARRRVPALTALWQSRSSVMGRDRQ